MGLDLRELPTKDGMFLRDAVGGTIKDTDEKLGQVLVSFPHDTVDTYQTTFDHDAFRDSFAARMPLMCWQHDLRDPIGHAIDAQVLPRSNELVGQLDDFDAVPHAKRAYSQIQSGTIKDFSFGFRQPKYEPHRSMRGVRNIRSAVMLEFSPVSVGSIPGAVATGLREEEFMAEHSAADIAALVAAKVIDPEEGKRMLAEMDGWRQHITVPTPEQQRIAELTREIEQLRGGVAVGFDGSRGAGDDGAGGADDGTGAGDGGGGDAGADGDGAAGGDGGEERHDDWTPPVVPETVTADDVLAALHPSWSEPLREAGVRIAIAGPGEEFQLRADTDAESAGTIASAIEAACDSANDWLKDVDITSLPDPVQQSLALFQAAATSAEALLEVMGLNDPDEPAGTRAGDAEDMAPTKVKCDMCGGSGETEDGKTCPQCGGTGVEAVTRSMAEDAPENAVECPRCHGTGKGPDAKGKCPMCSGKGYMTREDVADHDQRAAGNFSDKPWSGFKQKDYSPEQWKSACLIVQGDGSSKAMCKLPVKEPDGTYNVNGISAAATRLDATDASDSEKADAAGSLASLYSKMKKDPPESVTKYTSREAASEGPSAEELEQSRQEALERLNKRVPAAV